MKRLTSSLSVLAIAFSGLFLSTVPAQAGEDKVKVCHSTGSTANPYVFNEPNLNAFLGEQGHAGHAGDIYPSFQYLNKAQEPVSVKGKNWGLIPELGVTGESVYNNGCEVPVKEHPEPEPEFEIVKPNPPTYTPGTCLDPKGSVSIPEQPKGVKVPEGLPKLNENGEWYGYLFADTALGYKFEGNTDQYYYSFKVQSPDPKDCDLPATGASDYALPIGGAALLLGLGSGAVYLSRRGQQA